MQRGVAGRPGRAPVLEYPQRTGRVAPEAHMEVSGDREPTRNTRDSVTITSCLPRSMAVVEARAQAQRYGGKKSNSEIQNF